MSHFVTLVIVKKDHYDWFEETAEELLAPFDEEIEEDEYEVDCYCINSIARRAGLDQAVEEYGKTIEQLRKDFHEEIFMKIHEEVKAEANELFGEFSQEELNSDIEEIRQAVSDWHDYLSLEEEERSNKAWEEYIKPFVDLRDKKTAEHPMYNKPDSDCEECHGTGKRMTTYNPDSKWDWYSYGGRWYGNFKDVPNSIDMEFIEKEHLLLHTAILDDNVRLCKDLADAEYVPFAILDSNGNWHERGEMGWWANVTNGKDKEDWKAEVKRILSEQEEGSVAVLYDLHI